MSQQADIQPVPVPVTIKTIGMKLPDGDPVVVLQIMSPTGSGVYFLPADFARQIGANIIDTARKTMSGLIVPNVHLNGFGQGGLGA